MTNTHKLKYTLHLIIYGIRNLQWFCVALDVFVDVKLQDDWLNFESLLERPIPTLVGCESWEVLYQKDTQLKKNYMYLFVGYM